MTQKKNKKKFKGRTPKPRYSYDFRICIDCENEYPLDEEHFYKDRKGTDGYKMRCKECQRKYDLRKYHEKTKRLNETIFNVNGKSKVPYQKETKISKQQMKKWERDQFLICVLQCKFCNKIHEIRNATETYNCNCKHNLLFGRSINYLWSKVLHINKLIKKDYIAAFDPWK